MSKIDANYLVSGWLLVGSVGLVGGRFERKSFGWTMNDQFFAGCLTSACVMTLFWGSVIAVGL